MSPDKETHNHHGHRQRMKGALLENGTTGMDELDLLEMLLYFVVPRTDTRDMARDLLSRFGSIEGILNAPQGEISKTAGLKDGAEILFALIRELFYRYGGTKSQASILEPEKMQKFLVDIYKDISVETVYALYFNQSGEMVGKQPIFRGGVSSAQFSLRAVTEGAIRSGGNSVVLAHNHPSDVLAPSSDDIISTKRIAAHLAANDIELVEHYIVGKTKAVGFYANKEI